MERATIKYSGRIISKMLLGLTILMSGISPALACSYDDATEGSNTLFVSTTGTDSTQCGLTRASACATVNQAVAYAVQEGLMTDITIHVAPGIYQQNVAVREAFDGITIQGSGRSGICRTLLLPQNNTGFNAPAGVPVNYGFLVIRANRATVTGFAVEFTETEQGSLDREMGVFLARPATNANVHHNSFNRANNAERSAGPGSRGLFSIQGGGHNLHHNTIACDGSGAFEDGIHIPDHDVKIHHNSVCNANRIGIVTVQETGASNSTNNRIAQNTIGSAPFGVEIQGDNNRVNRNDFGSDVDTSVLICGDGCGCHYVPSNPADTGDRIASDTTVILSSSTSVMDCGINTVIHNK